MPQFISLFFFTSVLMLLCVLSSSISQTTSLSPLGGGLTFKRGVFRSVGRPETMMSVCYGRSEALVFSGAATGDVYIWKEPLLLKTVKAHDGPVFAMFSLDKVISRSAKIIILLR